MATRIGVVGIGKLGSALHKGLEARRQSAGFQIRSYRRSDDQSRIGADNDVIVVCVKPSQIRDFLRNLSGQLTEKHLVLSLAAGIRVADLESACGGRAAVVRVVTNTPVAVGAGTTALVSGAKVSADQLRVAHAVFGSVGTTCEIPESLADAVTGLAACGPAFVFQILEGLMDAGIYNGIPAAQSLDLAIQTLVGSCEMARQTERHPAELRQQVTTPGGATIEGVATLEAAGLRSALIKAVTAATEKARKLG